MSKYEVYVARLGGEVLYIGEGVRWRHLHCNSGASNVYLLNYHHFKGDILDIEVIVQSTKESAKALEQDLISKLSPKYNLKDRPDHLGEWNEVFTRFEKTVAKSGKNLPFSYWMFKGACLFGDGVATREQIEVCAKKFGLNPARMNASSAWRVCGGRQSIFDKIESHDGGKTWHIKLCESAFEDRSSEAL